MVEIKRNYSIQWVGPFHSYDDLKDYIAKGKSGEVACSNCFTFYYISGINRIGRPTRHKYFGIHHELDGIEKRLNMTHSKLKAFKHDDSTLDIWLGSFGDLRYHSHSKVEEVETLFIRKYRELFRDNNKKKKYSLDKLESIVIVNLWYNINEKPWVRKPASASYIDDVIVWEKDEQRLLTSRKISEVEID